jgi:uncharacterized repeat protein (TIGR02543 family)
MKRISFSLLTITVLSFILVQSCSTEEDLSVPTVQTPELEQQVKQYTLTVTSAEGGTVSTEGGIYDDGTELTITATPNEGYRFTGWEGNDSTSESITITLNSNQTFKALFELIPPVQYTLTVSASEGGTISGGGDTSDERLVGLTFMVVSGTEVTFTATPNEGYEFIGWEGNDSTSENLTVTVNSNQSVQALFELITLNILFTAGYGGSIKIKGENIDNEGVELSSAINQTEISVEAIPEPGFVFVGWRSNFGDMFLAEKLYFPTEYQSLPSNTNITLNAAFVLVQAPAPLFDKDLWWGQIVDFPPEIFFASDLSNTLREKFMIDLNLAISQFGNYGPLECYVLGNSTNAANELAIQYCNRRVERGQEGDLNGCIDYQMNDNSYGMEYYRKDSDGNGIWASLNGARHHGYHLLQFSKPYHYEEDPSSIEYSIVVFHEYFHVVNAANVFSDESIYIEGIGQQIPERGPPAMVEGSANYLSHYLARKLFDYPNSYLNLRQYMVTQMDNIKRARNEFPNCNNVNLSEINFGDSCDMYSLGTWGIAYLLDRADNINAYQEVLFPLINDIGYYAAFEQTFGITFDEFEMEFRTFLELPILQQLEIIPDI